MPVRMGVLVPRSPFRRRFDIFNSFDEIPTAADLLEDEGSREQLWEILTIFCANAPVWIENLPSEEYFNTPYIKLGKNEVFVDAGMYDGKTSVRFAELYPDYKDIYGIEANPDKIDDIKRNLEGYRDMHIYSKALCDKDMELRFKSGYEGARLSEDGDIIVNGLIGDDLEIEPTFMKFDIEGAEYDALNGFSRTIQRYKPKLAISAYHSLEDHWRLIPLVKNLCPDYKLYLKHHYGYEDMYGTILYAVVDPRG